MVKIDLTIRYKVNQSVTIDVGEIDCRLGGCLREVCTNCRY